MWSDPPHCERYRSALTRCYLSITIHSLIFDTLQFLLFDQLLPSLPEQPELSLLQS